MKKLMISAMLLAGMTCSLQSKALITLAGAANLTRNADGTYSLRCPLVGELCATINGKNIDIHFSDVTLHGTLLGLPKTSPLPSGYEKLEEPAQFTAMEDLSKYVSE